MFLAYGLVGPFAGKLKTVVEEDNHFYQLIKEVLVANLHNHNAAMCIEVGRQNTPTTTAWFLGTRGCSQGTQTGGGMKGLALFTSILITVATSATAETLVVRSGEHDSHTRLVVKVPPGTEWVLARRKNGARLTVSIDDVLFQTEGVSGD